MDHNHPIHNPYIYQVGDKVYASLFAPDALAWYARWDPRMTTAVNNATKMTIADIHPLYGYLCVPDSGEGFWFPSCSIKLLREKRTVINVPMAVSEMKGKGKR